MKHIAALLAAGIVVAPEPVGAQDYPTRTVTIVVPFAPGGAADIVARLVGRKLSERFGKPVVVENRTGGGTTIAAAAVARSAPDGHTLMLSPSGTLAINPTLYKKLPYDPPSLRSGYAGHASP